jgi:flagellar hook-associated protein 2
MAITVSGIGSGIDIDGLVSQLVEAEGQPAAIRLARKEATFQADLSAIGTLKSTLSSFQLAVQALQTPADFLSRTATSSDDELFTTTAESTAAPGSYQIEVTQLAEAARIRSNDFTSESEIVGTGTLDISLGAETFSLTVDSSNQTLEGIRDAINSAENNPGITASLINVDSGTRLILSSEKIGLANTITVTATDDDALDGFDLTRLDSTNLTTIQAAQDAIVLIDQQQVTRDSNSFSDAITGVTFSLLKADVGTIETLTVGLDKSAITNKINNFVEAYNSVSETINALSAFDADSGIAGALQGDAGLRNLQSQIRQTISDPISGLDVSTLASLGITTDADGQLEVDSDDLNAVIDNDFTAVSKLFTNESGLANKFDSLLDQYVSSTGILTTRTEGLELQIDTLDDDRERLNSRLEIIEARYRSQFIALDSLVSQLQSVGNFLTQQLANLPGPRRSDN